MWDLCILYFDWVLQCSVWDHGQLQPAWLNNCNAHTCLASQRWDWKIRPTNNKNTACYSSAIPVRLWTLRLQALVFQLQELSLFKIICSKSSKHVDWTNGQSLKPPRQFKRAWCLILHRDSFHWICTLCRICRPFLHWVWVFSKPLSIVRVIATGDVAGCVKLGWGGYVCQCVDYWWRGGFIGCKPIKDDDTRTR